MPNILIPHIGGDAVDFAISEKPTARSGFGMPGSEKHLGSLPNPIQGSLPNPIQSAIFRQPGPGRESPVKAAPVSRPVQAHERLSIDRIDRADVLRKVTGATQGQESLGHFHSNTRAQQAIEGLCNTILERFPLAASTIILFVGTQSNPLTATTCSSVASSLARRNVGEILLVDSTSQRELSHAYHASDQKGISNLLAFGDEWQSLLVKLPDGNLSFLPAGTSHWEHWGAEHRLRELSSELKRRYQFVCVAANDPQQANAKIWSTICDGSFLLVSLKNANPSLAEAAVVELQSSGARLLGCVVTEADLPNH